MKPDNRRMELARLIRDGMSWRQACLRSGYSLATANRGPRGYLDNQLSVVKDFERAAQETTWEPETLRKIITHPGDGKGDGDRRWPRVMPSDCPPCQRSCRIGEQMKLSACLFVLAAAGKTLRKWLILFFLFVSPTFAQIKTITGGNYQNTNGTPCAGCVLYLQLGTDATVIGTTQIIPPTNTYTLDANGNVPANSNLWANDQMQPGGLTYQATLTLPGGGRIWGPEFLFISGPSPISLTQIVPVASSSVFFAAPALLGVSNTFTGSNTFSQQIISTVTTGTAPFSIASTTVVPNLNAQLHNGLTAPGSAIVGVSDTQTLTNKTLTGATSGNSVTLLCSSGPGAAITGNSSAQTFESCTIPANAVANLKLLRVTGIWSHSTGTATVTYGLTLNGVACWPSNNTAATVGGLTQSANIIETGSTTGNVMTAQSFFSFTTTSLTGLAWTSAQTIAFTFNVANTDQVTPLFFLVELIQ